MGFVWFNAVRYPFVRTTLGRFDDGGECSMLTAGVANFYRALQGFVVQVHEAKNTRSVSRTGHLIEHQHHLRRVDEPILTVVLAYNNDIFRFNQVAQNILIPLLRLVDEFYARYSPLPFLSSFTEEIRTRRLARHCDVSLPLYGPVAISLPNTQLEPPPPSHNPNAKLPPDFRQRQNKQIRLSHLFYNFRLLAFIRILPPLPKRRTTVRANTSVPSL
ncbi:uncharacterized protein BDR25DRAFT_357478 [Lindgomyces ingoldianus]|uniref:Uncharacterized protein n=1 Tax=Lindgomyces ingoldianus TaxID=673940 RepID=A0ACB6QNG6_9PLEO|nr:uncharacterized protein BDR25DRAFT_357478 [Lindgomyces ingoldianus]KAF2468554.1 hypothetical protein BDR25DRAFT_357478 [Lindgomyces ingoldianus]